VDFWGITFGAAIASAAWLYQRAWERQEKRVLRYQEILDRLMFLTEGNLTSEKQNELIIEMQRLWLFAPDEVVLTGERFMNAVVGDGNDKEAALREYILVMRKDASMRSALVPNFWKTYLSSSAFQLRSAKANPGQTSAFVGTPTGVQK
jgi:hypothetical protein